MGGSLEGRVDPVGGVTGYPGDTVCGSTKAALVGFTKSPAREMVRFNVTSTRSCPGS